MTNNAERLYKVIKHHAKSVDLDELAQVGFGTVFDRKKIIENLKGARDLAGIFLLYTETQHPDITDEEMQEAMERYAADRQSLFSLPKLLDDAYVEHMHSDSQRE